MQRTQDASQALRPPVKTYDWQLISGMLLILLGGSFLGFSPILVRLSELPAEASAFWRVAIAAAVLAPWFSLGGSAPRSRLSGKPRPWLLALLGLFFAADVAVMHLAILNTSIANATLLTNCAPLFVGIFGLLALTEKPPMAFWKCLPVALVGVVMLMRASEAGSAGSLGGDVLALLAAVFYAAYLTTVSAAREYYDGLTVIVAATTGSAILLSPFLFFLPGTIPGDWLTWVIVLALGIGPQIGGQGCVALALRRLPVSLGSLALLIQPVVAAIASWFIFEEVLGTLQVAGAFLVLGAIVSYLRARKREPSPPAARS